VSSEDGTGVPVARRRLVVEVWIVLGLSLARSGVYSVIVLIDRYTASTALGDQTATLNPSQSDRPWLDVLYQAYSIAAPLVAVALALYLLAPTMRGAARRIGLDLTRPGRDVGVGVALAAAIGLPGLAFYALGRALGLTVQVQPAGLDATWWTVPVLVASAVQAGLLEEVVAVGYLSERLRELRCSSLRSSTPSIGSADQTGLVGSRLDRVWGVPAIVAASALLRGSYHLYQGVGPGIGNVVMGVVFAWWYNRSRGEQSERARSADPIEVGDRREHQRTRRVMPLVVAHAVMDTVVFVGYPLVPHAWLAVLRLT